MGLRNRASRPPLGWRSPPDVAGPDDAAVVHAASILKPHHTTAMAATMQAAVRARSRTWTFIVSIPFLHYPARTVYDSTICRQLWGRRKNGHRGSPGEHADTWAWTVRFRGRCPDEAGWQILAKRITLAGPN